MANQIKTLLVLIILLFLVVGFTQPVIHAPGVKGKEVSHNTKSKVIATPTPTFLTKNTYVLLPNSQFIQQNPQWIMAAVFTGIGILLIFALPLQKLIRSNIKKSRGTNAEITQKALIPQLIGVVFVITLAAGANNAWTYDLAIIIVATLVTELEFIEKV